MLPKARNSCLTPVFKNSKWTHVRNRNHRKKTSFHKKTDHFQNISSFTSQGLIRAVRSLQIHIKGLLTRPSWYVIYLRLSYNWSVVLWKSNNPNQNLNSNQLSSNKTRSLCPHDKLTRPSARPMRITSAFFKPAVEESPYQKHHNLIPSFLCPRHQVHIQNKRLTVANIDEKGWFVMSCLISFHFRIFLRLHMFMSRAHEMREGFKIEQVHAWYLDWR